MKGTNLATAADMENAGPFEGAYVVTLDATEDLSKMVDQDLLLAHSLCHAFHQSIEKGITIAGWEISSLVDFHKKLTLEMIARKMVLAVEEDALGKTFTEPPQTPEITKNLDEQEVMNKIHDVPKEVLQAEDVNLPVETAMVKALQYFTKFDPKAVLSALSIAENSGMLEQLHKRATETIL